MPSSARAPMPSSDRSLIELSIRTHDDATELFLFDGQRQLVASAPGRLTKSVPRGVYLVKARIGFTTEDHELVLDGSEPTKKVAVTLPPVKYVTPALIRDTASWWPDLEDMVQRVSQEAVPNTGYAALLTFVRPLHAVNDERPPTMAALLDAQWWPLTNAEAQTYSPSLLELHGAAGGPYWCGIHSREPGPYIVRFVAPNRRLVERLLFLVPDRAFHDFTAATAIPELAEEQEVCLPSYGDAACSYVRPDQTFSSENPSDRVEDIARLALTHDRVSLSKPLLATILAGDFESPMLGLYGAHLALRHWDPDKPAPDLKPAVKLLQDMLGAEHPDVAALALAAGVLPKGYQFHFPPMLAASWQLILEASAQRPELVPRDSFAARIADRVCGNGPWLLWESDAPRDRSRLPASVQAWLDGSAETAEPLEALKPAPEDAGLDPLDSVLVDTLRREKVTPVELREYVARPDERSAAAQKVGPTMPRLVRASGLPRSRIEERLKSLLPEPGGDRFDPTVCLGNKILWYTPREAWESMWQAAQLPELDLLASVAGGGEVELTKPSDIYATCLAAGAPAAWRWTTFEAAADEPVCLIDLATGADLLSAAGDRAVSFDATTGVVSVDVARLPDREWRLFALGAGPKLTATVSTDRAVFAIRREPPPARARDAAGLVAAGHLLAGWQAAVTRDREWTRPGLSWLIATAFARMQVLLDEVAAATPRVADECRFVLADLVAIRETRVDALKQGVWDGFKDEP